MSASHSQPPGTGKKRSMILGPTQRQALRGTDPEQRALGKLVGLTAVWWAVTAFLVTQPAIFGARPEGALEPTAAAVGGAFLAVARFERHPFSAQDFQASLIAIALCLPALVILDFLLLQRFVPLFKNNSGARWFVVHSIGNIFTVLFCIMDFGHAFASPLHVLSEAHCTALNEGNPFLAPCSDWPQVIIVALHAYHMLAFQLSGEDLFHHIVFVPIIAGANFAMSWGLSSNVLAFFISGLPGAVDYLLLAAVKAGRIPPMTEKRLNCSINTWLRSPGIAGFCVLALVGWVNPPAGVDVPPWYAFIPGVGLAFFNGQYYAQVCVRGLCVGGVGGGFSRRARACAATHAFATRCFSLTLSHTNTHLDPVAMYVCV